MIYYRIIKQNFLFFNYFIFLLLLMFNLNGLITSEAAISDTIESFSLLSSTVNSQTQNELIFERNQHHLDDIKALNNENGEKSTNLKKQYQKRQNGNKEKLKENTDTQSNNQFHQHNHQQQQQQIHIPQQQIPTEVPTFYAYDPK